MSIKKTIISNLIEDTNRKLSLKEIVEKTGISKTTAQRILKELNYKYETTPWNKGLTKESNASLMSISQKMKQVTGWKHTNETKEKIAESMKEHGGVKQGSGGYAYNYGDDIVNSDYELNIAQALDEEEIQWDNSNSVIHFNDKGITRMIYLGFYLPQYDIYLSVKYHINSDTRRRLMLASKQNDIKIIIVDEMMYRRIVYNNIKDVLKNSLQSR